MKTYRIVYWFNSITTECFIRAANPEEAEKLFRERKGTHKILKIEEAAA